MAKIKKKLKAVLQKPKNKAKAKRQKKYQWVFKNGKQVRIERPRLIDGMSEDEFILQNADPIWLHQNGMWDHIEEEGDGDSDH